LIIAQRPQDQFKLIKNLVKIKNKIKHFFLEKPINVNPNKSKLFIKYLNKKKINYSFGFILSYLKWYKFIKANNKKYQSFNFVWQIKKKNNIKSWKYQVSKGGGLLRFYGIHFIKVFFDLNFINIKHNKISKTFWKMKAYDKKSNLISIELKYANKDKFIYNFNNSNKISSVNPFCKNINKLKIDPRCFYIKNY
jgi:predicted dehydrogenase